MNDPFPQLYRQGALRFKMNQLEGYDLPPDAVSLLCEKGLPLSQYGYLVLGIRFIAHTKDIRDISHGHHHYLQIGMEWDHGSIICIRAFTGEVYLLHNSGSAVFLNSSLLTFFTWLEYFSDYTHRKNKRDAGSPVLSREEMLKKLEEMKKEGAIRKNRPAELSDWNVKKEYKQMKAYFTQTDPVAAKGKNKWWPLVLEQVKDDLL